MSNSEHQVAPVLVPGAATQTARRCAQCGSELSPLTSGKLSDKCPECLLELGFSGSKSGLATGGQFGSYTLVRQLGRGAMGVVYEAVQANLRRTVALKMILDANLAEPMVNRRFKIEAEAAAKLQHPHIVPVYEFGEWDGQPFLSMQLIRGETLKEKIRHGELCLAKGDGDPRAIARFMTVIARAVAHAHDHGVLHRDLKPANILVDTAGRPHLTDFGLAKILQEPGVAQASATVSGAVMGTPSYMAPEHACGGASSKATDIYSLGAILYEILTGQPPFKAPTALETIRLLTKDEPRKPRALVRNLPRDLETICLKCLDKVPNSRYASAEAVAEDLERWIEGRVIRARPASPIVAVRRWCRRNPAGTALILVLCAALALSLTVVRSLNRQARVSQALRDLTVADITDEVERIWKDPDADFVQLKNGYLAALAGYLPSSLDSRPPLQLTLGMELDGDPIARGAAAAPVLRIVEEKMEKILGKPVAFHLRLQKHRPDVADPSIKEEVDFQRLGPLAYIRAKEAASGVQLLVSERSSTEGIIFARKELEGLGITNLASIAGLRVAFAHSNSIISFCAKVQLARAGISGRNLRTYKHLDPPRTITSGDADPGDDSRFDFDESQFAHKVVINAILNGEYDVGECRRKHLDRLPSPDRQRLIVLSSFQVSPKVYIARSHLPSDVSAAFRDALLSFQTDEERKALRNLFASRGLDGFDKTTDQDLNEIRFALTNEVRFFETGE